jgi:nitrite reductase/ring-hydroxylating ferredoxin subunit
MSAPVRVAHVDEIPPGRGKVVQLGSRDLTIYNLEGRFFARVAHRPRVGGDELPGHAVVCEPHGHGFECTTLESPAHALSGEPSYAVGVDGEYVVVYVEDAAAD